MDAIKLARKHFLMPPFSPPQSAALERLQTLFEAHFHEHSEIGAAVSVWQGDQEILSLVGGYRDREHTSPWTHDTLVPIWSCTKGPAVATTLTAMEMGHQTLDMPLSKCWPAFGQHGKASLTLGELLSHQAGLAALDDPPPFTDHAAVLAALERQAPHEPRGHGYHPRTFGFLLDAVVQRLTSATSLGSLWREALAEPLGFDLWIGLPESEHDRVATIYPGRMGISQTAEEAPFYQALADPQHLAVRAFRSPAGLHAVSEMNAPEVWKAGYPAMGGLASAKGLAAFYAFLATGGVCAGESFFAQSTLEAMESIRIQGPDQVLCRETAFAAGFMKDPIDPNGQKRRQLFGPNTRAFGHPGAGGSLAFADPETGIGFAYVMNQMERSVFPTEKALRLVRALYGEHS